MHFMIYFNEKDIEGGLPYEKLKVENEDIGLPDKYSLD